MTKKIIALIVFEKEKDRLQQELSIKEYTKDAEDMELFGMIELPQTYLPKDMDVALEAVTKIGIDTIMMDVGMIDCNLMEEIHTYVSGKRLHLIEIHEKIILFKRFLMVLPEEKDKEGVQIQNAIIKYSKLESTKEVMDIIAIATEYSVIEIIVLSDQDTKWIQNTYLYKLKSIAKVLNIRVRFTVTLKDMQYE